ncbi:MAG: ATP-dependent Clp protease adaptor ClpS [Desulfovibrionaceae bacterium]
MPEDNVSQSKVHVESLLVEEPPEYGILLFNDDYTPMDFVVLLLKSVFHKKEEEAHALMLTIHNDGKGLCGIYTFEIAETRVQLVHAKAQEAGFPLRCIMQKM